MNCATKQAFRSPFFLADHCDIDTYFTLNSIRITVTMLGIIHYFSVCSRILPVVIQICLYSQFSHLLEVVSLLFYALRRWNLWSLQKFGRKMLFVVEANSCQIDHAFHPLFKNALL